MSEQRRSWETLRAAEMQREYGLYIENYPKIHIDPDEVPADLRDLAPLAERFGITCDLTRHDLGEKTTQADKDELSRGLRGRHRRINDWLNSLGIDSDNRAASHFIAMCVFELEENNGPGLEGDPAWWAERMVRKQAPAYDARHRQGPPCPKCGQPLRTTKARHCFSCGADWHGGT